jgi:hypothetical protein
MLITGLHTVCDCYCITCNSVLGWKYEVRPWGAPPSSSKEYCNLWPHSLQTSAAAATHTLARHSCTHGRNDCLAVV